MPAVFALVRILEFFNIDIDRLGFSDLDVRSWVSTEITSGNRSLFLDTFSLYEFLAHKPNFKSLSTVRTSSKESLNIGHYFRLLHESLLSETKRFRNKWKLIFRILFICGLEPERQIVGQT